MDITSVESYFTKNEWQYDKRDEDTVAASFSLNSKIKNIRVLFSVSEHDFIIRGISPIGPGKEEMAAAAEYLTRANYGLVLGKFELDYDRGIVAYALNQRFYGRASINEKVIDSSLDMVIAMFERYGEGLVNVVMGHADPKEEIEKAEADMRQGD